MDRVDLSGASFDVVIIGGGINGCASALDLASRGLSTLLIEKADFGSRTSSACYKIIHGGLRYLQHLDLKRVFESLNEQKWLRVSAPHLVRPMPFLIPTYAKFSKSKFFLGSGLTLYQLLDSKRNAYRGNAEELPNFKVLSKEQTLKIAPYLEQNGLTGSVVYYDCQVSHCERLTWSVAKTAARYGAKLANYTELVAARTENQKITALTLRDLVSKREFQVFPTQVISASGPWNGKVLKQLGINDNVPEVEAFSKGLQFAVPGIVKDFALAVDSTYQDPEAVVSSGARKLFIQPWKGLSLIGTSDTLSKTAADDFCISEKEVRELFDEIKKAYPDPSWDYHKIVFAFGGLRPLSDEANLEDAGHHSKTSRRPLIQDFSPQISNLIAMTGIKYTTFRLLAEQVGDLLVKKINKNIKSKTKNIKLIGAELSKSDVIKQALDEYPELKEVEQLYYTYGAELLKVLEYYDADIKIAESCFAAQNELCVDLSDILFRRTGICQQGLPDEDFLKRVIAKLSELGFGTKDKLEQQAANLKNQFNLHVQ